MLFIIQYIVCNAPVLNLAKVLRDRKQLQFAYPMFLLCAVFVTPSVLG